MKKKSLLSITYIYSILLLLAVNILPIANVHGQTCGDFGYFESDLNQDCQVNILDFASFEPNSVTEIITFASQWLECTDPAGNNCTNLAGQLIADVANIDFGTIEVGQSSADSLVTLTNVGLTQLTISNILLSGNDPNAFSVTHGGLPAVIPSDPNATFTFNASFTPTQAGVFSSQIVIQSDNSFGDVIIPLSGTGNQPAFVNLFRINCGEFNNPFTDSQGNLWATDSNFNTGFTGSTPQAIAGTVDDPIYKKERWDPSNGSELIYSFPVSSGQYRVRLHFAELYTGITGAGQRVFDVNIEGLPVLTNYDIFNEVGFLTAQIKEFIVTVNDSSLDIEFIHGIENPKINGIEVDQVFGQQSSLSVNPAALNFGSLVQYNSAGPINFIVTNNGPDPITLDSFNLTGTLASDIIILPDPNGIVLAPTGGNANFDATFTPQSPGTLSGSLEILSDDPAGSQAVILSGSSLPQGTQNIEITPSAISFDDTLLGVTSAFTTITITNNDSLPHTFDSVSIIGTDNCCFSTLGLPLLPLTLNPGENTSFNVTFTPLSSKAHQAQVQLNFDSSAFQPTIDLTGNGISTGQPNLQTNPKNIHFANTLVGQNCPPVTVTLRNFDVVPHNLFMIEMTGIDPNSFSVIQEPNLPINLDPNQSTQISVAFQPELEGTLNGDLKLHFDNHAIHVHVALTGQGVSTPVNDLQVNPTSVTFSDTLVGSQSTVATVTLKNNDSIFHEFMMAELIGGSSTDFALINEPNLPITLNPGEMVDLQVQFTPLFEGIRSTDLKLHFDNHNQHIHVPLSGIAIDPTPTPLFEVVARINCGGSDYTDPNGNLWIADTYYNGGRVATPSTNPISGTSMDLLYQTERYDHPAGVEMSYNIPIPEDGLYRILLHFAEISPFQASIGARLFDVEIEGNLILDDYDIFAVAGFEHAHIRQFEMNVTGALNIQFLHVPNADNPKISAIEVLKYPGDAGVLNVSPALHNWGHVLVDQPGDVKQITLTNTGITPINVSQVSSILNAGVGHDFALTIGGQTFVGGHSNTTMPTNVTIPPGQSQILPVQFLPTEVSENDVTLQFSGNFEPQSIQLLGAGTGEAPSHPFLHTVISHDPFFVDYDLDGMETVYLQGDESHTHEFGHDLTNFEWREQGILFATTPNVTTNFATGEHTVSLTIFDDNIPPESLPLSSTFSVVDPNCVPGAFVFYYDDLVQSPTYQLDPVPAQSDFVERIPTLVLENPLGTIGSSNFVSDVLVRIVAQIDITQANDYTFTLTGGADSLLLVNGLQTSSSIFLNPGRHTLDARFAVLSNTELPISIEYAIGTGFTVPIDSSIITHDESNMIPVINSLPTEGSDTGGIPTTITGLGFFPSDQVTVHWGAEDLTGPSLTVSPTGINFLTPPGTGTINVTVETPNGVSNSVPYTYILGGPPPILFNFKTLASNIDNVTQGAWGPDGRLYVGTRDGIIEAYTFDDDYNLTNTQTITTLTGLSNHEVTGIGFNPYEVTGPVKIYVAHTQLFAVEVFDAAHENCIGLPQGQVMPYNGQISVLTGPNFDTYEPLITGLPVSNHDHGVASIEFNNDGDMLFCVGGNTNAGVVSCELGGLPETPLSAAVVIAYVSRENFNGTITYLDPNGLPNNDQVFGETVDIAPGIDVEVFAPGVRNSFDLVYTTWGDIYTTDNDSGAGYGAASTGPDTQTLTPGEEDIDSVDRIIQGNYYGHPNRNRGRTDPRQNVYYTANSSFPGIINAAIVTFPSSINGIDEYRSAAFDSQMRGDLLVQKWNAQTYRLELSEDHLTVTNSYALLFNEIDSLDLLTGPGGALIGIDYSQDYVIAAIPNDISAVGLKVFDIFPWRAPATGGAQFVISGVGFETLATTSVTIGGLPATLTSVSPTRIRGIIPANAFPTTSLVDVQVTTNAGQNTFTEAFRYLFQTTPGNGAEGYMSIDTSRAGGPIRLEDSSTFNPETFMITNTSTGGQKIVRARLNLSGAILPDSVFDPNAIAGDTGTPKAFDVDGDDGVGLLGHQFLDFHDNGFDTIEITFNDFDPGESIKFSSDTDPTSIQGSSPPGPSHSGSINGLELTGSSITLEFDDATILTNDLFMVPSSVLASETTVVSNPLPSPTISIVGQAVTPVTVNNASQTVHITGPANTDVRVLVLECGLYVAGVPGGGFDLDPFEANKAVAIGEYSATIGAGGSVDIPITLTNSGSNDGFNYIMATCVDGSGKTGLTSNTIVLDYQP